MSAPPDASQAPPPSPNGGGRGLSTSTSGRAEGMGRRLLRRFAEGLPWLMTAVLFGVLARTWLARIPYPYDLEWMEGGMLAHAWRLSRGEPLYVMPNPDFVPYIYPPGYSALVALVSSPVGIGPMPARSLSLFATMCAAAAVVYALRQLGARWAAAVGAGAVFVGTYRSAGAFYDLARPDACYVALLGWAVALALTPGRGAAVASGLLLAASFLMKHNAAVFGVPLAIGLLVRSWRDGLSFVAASMGPALLMVGLLQWRSGGLFLTYLIEVPRSHPSVWWRLYPGTPLELGTALPVATSAAAVLSMWHLGRTSSWPRPLVAVAPAVTGALAGWWATRVPPMGGVEVYLFPGGPGVFSVVALLTLAALRLAEVRRRPLHWRSVLLAGLLAMAVLLAGVMRAHNGGFLNVHTHMFWATALIFGVALRWAPPWLAGLLVALQLAWSTAYTGGRSLRPTPADVAAGDRMVEALRGAEGPVLSPYAAWLPTYAGHPPSLHYMGVWDLDYEGGPLVEDLGLIRKAVRRGYWPTALDADQAFPYGLRKHYRREGRRMVGDGPALRPKTGWGARPEQIRVPR